MYQSGRVGDEEKERKSPAKSGRVGISASGIQNIITMCFSCFLGNVFD